MVSVANSTVRGLEPSKRLDQYSLAPSYCTTVQYKPLYYRTHYSTLDISWQANIEDNHPVITRAITRVITSHAEPLPDTCRG